MFLQWECANFHFLFLQVTNLGAYVSNCLVTLSIIIAESESVFIVGFCIKIGLIGREKKYFVHFELNFCNILALRFDLACHSKLANQPI